MSPDSSKEEKGGRGRHRRDHKDAGALASEHSAKGHDRRSGGPGAGEEPEISEPDVERGNQKGYGKQQDEEGLSRHTPWGTRAPSAHHG